MKILINTDSARLHSGLAETTRNIFLPLVEKYPGKYEILQVGWFDFLSRKPIQVPWRVIPTNPNDMEDRYGKNTLPQVIQNYDPDIVFGYGDLWTFDHILDSHLRNNFRLCVYYTVDGQPYFGDIEEDGSTTWGKILSKADRIVTLSQFGKDTLKANPELKNIPIDVIPHGLDLEEFPRLSEKDIEIMRKGLFSQAYDETQKMGLDKPIIAGWVGRNQFRKQNYKLFEAAYYMIYGEYLECKDCNRVTLVEYNHAYRRPKPTNPSERKLKIDRLTLYDPDYDYSYCWYCKSNNITKGEPINNFFVYFHMSKSDPGYSPSLHSRMWKIQHRCMFTDSTSGASGIDHSLLCKLYSCFDFMYYLSGGEGFGNPALECLAAGTPVIYSNYSSHADFLEGAGLPVRVTYIPEISYGIMRSAVSTETVVEATLKLLRDEKLRKKLGREGRKIARKFDRQKNVEKWDKIFSSLYEKPVPRDGNKLYLTSII